MKRVFVLSNAAAAIVLSSLSTSADYTIILKNGREFTVQNYREEVGIVKFYGFGGEISILKNQIQTIRPAAESKPSAEAPRRFGPADVAENRMPALGRTNIAPQTLESNPVGEEKGKTEPSVKQEEVYQQMIKKIDDQLKELRSQYATETRGNTGDDPFLFTTEEAFRGHQEDLLSRLRDAQYRAQGLPSGGEAQSPPFSTNPPPAYTEKQKLLSGLRNQLHDLESERERVIAEMKTRDMDTGSLSSE